MKNLILFHMESVSNVIFKLNEDYFPNLYKWRKYFQNYMNYYSTATSTVMVMADLFFGDMSVFEQSDYLEDIYSISYNRKTIFEYLNAFGYSTQAFYYGYNDKKRNNRLNNVINKGGTGWTGDDITDFLQSFICFTQEEPFAIFIEENVSHIKYDGKRLEKRNKPESVCRKERYQAMDETVGKVLEQLEAGNLLDDTVVVLYGDHGDEYWFHGFHEGYTHAIEPYTSLIHCPLFVLNGMREAKINSQLISTTDIFNLILNELGIEKRKIGSEYIISRNLFARQKRKADIFNKGYSITNGNYTLLLTRKGLSMFENEMDQYNLNNVLDFFRLKRSRLEYNSKFESMISDHYKGVMTQAEQNEIEKQFEILRKRLYEYIAEYDFLAKRYNLNRIYRGNRYKDFNNMRSWNVIKMKIGNKPYEIKRIIEKRRKSKH